MGERHATGPAPSAARPLATLPGAERALDLLNILLSDVRYGLGAYLGVYLLTKHGWDAAEVGLALSLGGLAGLLSQTPIGLLVDAIRAKRLLLAGVVVVVTATCLVIPLAPRFWPVAAAAVIGALAGTAISPTIAAISLGIVGPARFIPDPVDRISWTDRPPPGGMAAVVLINRIPYHPSCWPQRIAFSPRQCRRESDYSGNCAILWDARAVLAHGCHRTRQRSSRIGDSGAGH